MTTIEDAFDKAKEFLATGLSPEYLIPSETSARNIQQTSFRDDPAFLISSYAFDDPKTSLGVALKLLSNLHQVLQLSDTAKPDASELILSQPQYRLILYGLLEVVVLEGIQPSLPHTIGTPFEQRTKLFIHDTKLISQTARIPSRSKLVSSILGLWGFSKSSGVGIGPFVRERILPDFICGLTVLAFDPLAVRESESDRENENQSLASHGDYQNILLQLLNNTSTPSLLQVLTSLVKPSSPLWFRAPLLEQLSRISLRPLGVRNIIDFVASNYRQDPADDNSSSQRQGPKISSDAITRAASLISSVPNSMSSENYFIKIADQLFDLLDGVAGPDLSHVAATIIGKTFLGSRTLGAPGAAGYEVFAKPLIETVCPSAESSKHIASPDSFNAPLVTEGRLGIAIRRLSTILRAVPNPGLTKRLLGSLFFSLWALHYYSKQRSPESKLFKDTWTLLEFYTARCATTEQLLELLDKIMWDGPPDWIFGPGEAGGIQIRLRPKVTDETTNIIRIMNQLEHRSDSFVGLLKDAVDDTIINQIFLDTVKRWLSPNLSYQQKHILEDDADDPFRVLISATVAKKIMENLQKNISGSYVHLILLVIQLLKEYIQSIQAARKKQTDLHKASYKGLGNIATNLSTNQHNLDTFEEQSSGDESSDIAATALGLLNAILVAEDASQSTEMKLALNSLSPQLSYLAKTNEPVPDSIRTSSTKLQSLVALSSDDSESRTETTSGTSIPDSLPHDRELLKLALSDLGGTHPAVRAQALSAITNLITLDSPVIDPQATTHLLLTSVRDPDEYVFLAAIRALTKLSTRHAHSVLQLLVLSYLDKPEDRTIDERLRIGEAMAQILEMAIKDNSTIDTNQRQMSNNIQTPSLSASPTLIRHLFTAFTAAASRRGARPKETLRRDREEARQQQEARRAWGGDVPDPLPLATDLENVTAEDEHAASILSAWQATSDTDDIRLRASATTLLSKVVVLSSHSGSTPNSNPTPAVDPQLTTEALDLSTAILTHEKSAAATVLRRAAAALAVDIAHTLSTNHTSTRNTNPDKILGKSLDGAFVALGNACALDADNLVKDHASIAVQTLREWRLRTALENVSGLEEGRSGDDGPRVVVGSQGFGFGAQARLAGLSVNVKGRNGGDGVVKKSLIEEVDDV